MNGHQLKTLFDQVDQPSQLHVSSSPAAVAAIFRAATDRPATELLFIQRATSEHDPWSGQMAFPGGKWEPADGDEQRTAVRETWEEVGLPLDDESYLGTLTKLDGGRATNRPMDVSAHGFWLDNEHPELRPNDEVAEIVWVDLDQLGDRTRYIDYRFPPTGTTFPAIQLNRPEQVIWGLTLRFLADLFHRMKRPFVI